MTTKDLRKFAIENWDNYKTSITCASTSSSGIPLVRYEHEIYNFDEISNSVFSGRNPPSSADALNFQKRNIELIEFKSGFKQKVSKDKFDPIRGACPKTNEICSDYWDLFWENQDRKQKELIESIRLKAIESYILLEKHIFPLCDDFSPHANAQLCLIVVIDENSIDGIEGTLAELGERDVTSSNCFSSIRQALSRLLNRQDISHTPYFFDRIEVLSATDYKNRLKLQKEN